MPRPSVAATALHKAPALPAPTGRRVPRPTATPPPRTTKAPRIAKGAKGLKGGKDDKDTGGDGEKRDASGLTEGERKQLKELKSRDTEVRSHENAHQSSGGQLAGSPSYTYQTGPDGQRYAIGGEVSIDVSPEDDPAATIAKMERVSRAATAPAEPSPQDFKVAAAARRMMAEAQRDLDAAKLDEMQGGGDTAKDPPGIPPRTRPGRGARPGNPARKTGRAVKRSRRRLPPPRRSPPPCRLTRVPRRLSGRRGHKAG